MDMETKFWKGQNTCSLTGEDCGHNGYGGDCRTCMFVILYGGMPVPEEIKEEPIKEEPVKEEPVREEPVREEPVREEPVREEPVNVRETPKKPRGRPKFKKQD